MTIVQKLQQDDYYEVDILGGMYTYVTSDGVSAHAVVNGILEDHGFDDRMMQCGENPLYEKTGDGKHILATITLYKPDGQPYTTEEFRQRGRDRLDPAATDDASEGEG